MNKKKLLYSLIVAMSSFWLYSSDPQSGRIRRTITTVFYDHRNNYGSVNSRENIHQNTDSFSDSSSKEDGIERIVSPGNMSGAVLYIIDPSHEKLSPCKNENIAITDQNTINFLLDGQEEDKQITLPFFQLTEREQTRAQDADVFFVGLNQPESSFVLDQDKKISASSSPVAYALISRNSPFNDSQRNEEMEEISRSSVSPVVTMLREQDDSRLTEDKMCFAEFNRA